ncbi:MAG: phospho-sugar mutase, partial [Alicyclobacillus sp.]|nr:phospho-sugar mutase [Alicyclobacillus sp.]
MSGAARTAEERYEEWLNYPTLPDDLRKDLERIRGNQTEIEDRFNHHLHFGTAGLRAVMGAGLNRLNIYTIRRTSWALAQYLLRQGGDAPKRGVAIGYDCRHNSKTFAEETGRALAAMGVKAYVSPYLCPTPEVSFAIRHLHAAAGVMITASHNPPEYNGYKVYGPEGYQLLPDGTEVIRQITEEMDDIFAVPTLSLDDAMARGLFLWTDPSVRQAFLNAAVDVATFGCVEAAQRAQLTIVYTPLHGAGNIPVREVLKAAGYPAVHVVPDQEQPNGDFPTVKSPNPEEPEALDLGIRLASSVRADVVMGTDPDSDRVGIAVRDGHGDYQLLTGNQVGALLTDFMIRARKAEGRFPGNDVVYKTIVTSDLGKAIATANGVAVKDVLTGFKYIGSGLTEDEQSGRHTFLLGYEESYGYLVSPIVRDKDAVETCLAIAEMTTYWKAQGKSLVDALDALFRTYGYHREQLFSTAFEGADALDQQRKVMDALRQHRPNVEGLTLAAVDDYEQRTRRWVRTNASATAAAGTLGETVEPLTLPQSDVLKYLFADGSWMAVRPSGTEPKMKVYLAARGSSDAECRMKLQRMREAIEPQVRSSEVLPAG